MQRFDLLALDGDDRPLLIVEAKARTVTPPGDEAILRRVWGQREAIPYGLRVRDVMVADPESMRLYHFDGEDGRLVQTWPTADILGVYTPDFRDRIARRYGVSEDFLAGMIDSWMGDLIYRWKSEAPPGIEGWRVAGLLDRFRKGSTRSGVPLGFHPVS